MKNINDDKPQKAKLSLGNGWRRYRLSQELNSLDDRMLADIGTCRAEIPMIVEKSFPRFRLMDWAARLLENLAESKKYRKAAWELSAFDDRLLADIGLYRSDVSSLSEGYLPARLAGSSPKVEAANDDHLRAA